jgi:hypothetical protein
MKGKIIFLVPLFLLELGVNCLWAQDELSVTINTKPNSVRPNEDFKVIATVPNASGVYNWYLQIMMAPGNFDEFTLDNSFRQTAAISEGNRFESRNFKLTAQGTYKAYLYVYEHGSFKTAEKEFSISIGYPENHNDVQVAIGGPEVGSQLEFPLGSKIPIRYYVTVNPIGSASWISRYDGVKQVEAWHIKPSESIQQLKNITYTTTLEKSNSVTDKYYDYGFTGNCITLDQEGVHTIEMQAWAGYWSSQFIHFNPKRHSTITRDFIAVDCDKEILLVNKNELDHFNGNIKGGFIKVSPSNAIIINSGETYSLSAFKSIILKPGTHIKTGANFTAKTIKCPEWDNNNSICYSLKSANMNTDVYASDETDENELIIYPNPNNGQFEIRFLNGEIIKEVKVYTLTGALIYVDQEANCSNITVDISEHGTGVYLLKIDLDSHVVNHKILVK